MKDWSTLQQATFIFAEAFTCAWLLCAVARLALKSFAKPAKKDQAVQLAVPQGDEDCSPAPLGEFDTRKARPLQPAVAAQRFVDWMRLNEFTDYIWIGELDECYIWHCREENYFPVEAKALRELLYQLPGVYWGRPRLGGAGWERFRRQMEEWHVARGLPCPVRPVVARIMPCDVLQAVRVRESSGEVQVATGREPRRVRSTADQSKRYLEIKHSRRVQQRSSVVLGSDGVAMRTVA